MKKGFFYRLGLLLMGLNFSGSDKVAAETAFTAEQKKGIEIIVQDHLLKKPEIIINALEDYKKKKEEEEADKNKVLIQKHKNQLFKNPDDYSIGQTKGAVDLVVFLEPYCGYCRKFHQTVSEALKNQQDSPLKNMRLIIKALPIFGKESEEAVRALYAAQQQGHYDAMQQYIFNQKNPATPEQIQQGAVQSGLDVDRFKKDLSSEKVNKIIATNFELAKSLGINGTPTFVIGDQIIPGMISLDQLKILAQAIPQEKKNDPK